MFLLSQSKLFVCNIKNVTMPFVLREACRAIHAVPIESDPEVDLDQPKIGVSDSVRKAIRQKLHKRFHHYTGIWESLHSNYEPRMDELYYKPSDMTKRDFQQTWAECPPTKKVRHKMNFGEDDFQFVSRRKKPYQLKTAVKFIKLKSPSSICQRLANTSCKSDRYPPSCKVYTPVANCRKECCPHPSFSECCHPDPPPIRPKEKMWYSPTSCETNEYFRHKILNKLPPPLPAWPPLME